MSPAGEHDFHFRSGETLPELRIHYRTFGAAVKDARGVVTNAVLIMHGTGGSGSQFTGRGFAGEVITATPATSRECRRA